MFTFPAWNKCLYKEIYCYNGQKTHYGIEDEEEWVAESYLTCLCDHEAVREA